MPFRQRHISADLERLLGLIFGFVIAPALALIPVGILILVFSTTPASTAFGVLVLAMVGAMAAGATAMLVYVFRSRSLARLQTEFVAKVSHDLRTPLTSIRLFIETLQLGRAADPKKTQDCLECLAAETARLAAMIDRLLAWARMEAGRRVYELGAVAPEEIVRGARQALSPQLLDEPAEVEATAAPGLPAIHADRDAIVEALWNLLTNAHRYTGDDKRIALRAAADGADRVVFSVGDNGPGIPAAEQRKIWEKFYRGKNAEGKGGSGLGLAIVAHVARAHRAQLTIGVSHLGGAEFRLSVPVHKED
jgi:two-component system phosphate regulon sensor histidine kinase PhoR